MEISSKFPVSRARQVVEPVKRVSRDPRFETFAGKMNEDLFKRSYGFLSSYEQDEIEQLKAEKKKSKDPERRAEIDDTLSRMLSRKKTNEAKDKRQKIKTEWRKKEIERVKDGKTPFYMKNSDLKKRELVDKFNKLSEKGQDLDKLLEKRRKKNASREHRRIPGQRRSRANEE
ncbi:hypothetical protein BC831DRAFT_435571 [Entophlyctis helioformis]|nr:hypothetical protein BC831DRAFT_435571 [Entophlyctis helioformis]